VTKLDRSARIEELARMLGGEEITATTRKHAAELLGK
jgi:DNA repair protein RecN (Recombination protein N)